MQLVLGELFGKPIWAAHLVFISLCCYLAASIGAIVVQGEIAPVNEAQREGVVARNPSVPVINPLGLSQFARLTGLRVPESDAVGSGARMEDEVGRAIKSSLRVKLLGTLRGNRSEWSLAAILDLGTSRARTYWIGDRLQGAEVLEIHRDRAIILNNRRREYIDGEPAAPAEHPDQLQHAAATSGIRALSEKEYQVPRREIDNILANFTQVVTKVRLVPVSKDGQVQGFRMLSIWPSSIFSELGFQNEDVIRKINGYELNSVEKALELYTKLRQVDRIDVQYERQGVSRHRTYSLQ